MCDKNNRTVIAALVVAAMGHAAAQAPAFDAAAVRPSAQRAAGSDWVFRPGGQFMASNITVLELIAVAYGVETFRIGGGPDWIRAAPYDIQTRAAAAVTLEETRLMLRTLLQERFQLRMTRERRDIALYALLLSRGDRRTGGRLQPATASSCVDRGEQPLDVSRDALPSCGRLFTNPGRVFGRRVPLDLLAARLSPIVQRLVVNRTGLTGMFDLELEWTPDSGPSLATPGLPALFTALAEQLGLKLESSTGPADILVIDAIERPSQD
jgi:uncharacterized protein (TIGR03435 family)